MGEEEGAPGEERAGDAEDDCEREGRDCGAHGSVLRRPAEAGHQPDATFVVRCAAEVVYQPDATSLRRCAPEFGRRCPPPPRCAAEAGLACPALGGRQGLTPASSAAPQTPQAGPRAGLRPPRSRLST